MLRPIARAVFLSLLAASPAWAQQPAEPPLPMPGLTAPEPAGEGVAQEFIPNGTIATQTDAPPMTGAPLLTVDQDRLFVESAWGRRAQEEFEAKGNEIAEENEALAMQLQAEEASLTEQRSALDPAEFRRLADAFDSRATAIRRERAQAVQDLNAMIEADRTAFYRAALPVMGEMMQERGAVAVLDRRTVFVSLDAIDITSDLVRRLDAEIGDGAQPDGDEAGETGAN